MYNQNNKNKHKSRARETKRQNLIVHAAQNMHIPVQFLSVFFPVNSRANQVPHDGKLRKCVPGRAGRSRKAAAWRNGRWGKIDIVLIFRRIINALQTQQNLPLVEIGRRVNAMSQVVTLLTDIAGRNNDDDVRDRPPAAIPQQMLPVVSLPKIKLGKNKSEAEPAMPKPLALKSESESESESSSSEEEATPPKKAQSEGKSPGSVDGTGKGKET